MKMAVARYQRQLDDLAGEVITVLPDGRRKYTLAERARLNNLRARLVNELHHMEVMAAFEAASVVVVRQPTEAEVESLKATLVELSKPLDALNDARAVIDFVNGLATRTAAQLEKLAATVAPKS
jgi:hypothetical protein